MKLSTTVSMLAVCAAAVPLAAQYPDEANPVEARLWLDGRDEPIVQSGDRLPIRYRTSFDAYTAIFRIDTDGRISLLQPSSPWQDGRIRGDRDQRLVLERSPFWTVTDDPGVGYIFLVASPRPLDLSRFVFHPRFGWDLSPVGSHVYDDPYLAMDDFVAALIPFWETVPYALDFVTYHVGEARAYPRFLCYDCHDVRSYADWNPYAEVCPEYRIVVYDDPYFQPAFRYSGTRTVFPRPLPNRPRYALAVRGGSQAWAPIVRPRAAPARPTEFKAAPGTGMEEGRPERRPARASTRSTERFGPGRRSPPSAGPSRASSARAERPDVSPSSDRRGTMGGAPAAEPGARPSAGTSDRAGPRPGASSRRRMQPQAREQRPSPSSPNGRARAATSRRPTSVTPSRAPPSGAAPRARTGPSAATARPRPTPGPGAGSRPGGTTSPAPRSPRAPTGPRGGPGNPPGG